MNSLFIFYLLPLIFSMFLALPIKHSEKLITRMTSVGLFFPLIASLCLIVSAFRSKIFPIELQLGSVKISGHIFPFVAWIDHNTLVLLGLSHLLGLLVLKFSHGYLHLEKGYQRFFSTILFFIFGMQVLSLAGNLDLFFAGWEIVGFSSFLLIGFYRSHVRSVSNAWRIYNIYRICDVGLLAGAVLGHLMWHEATRFSSLASLSSHFFHKVDNHSLSMLYASIIFASLGKSAQFPFHNWPARAMEGPTPSSAIFYGALSIHAGVFLLIRTQPLWSHSVLASSIIGIIGLATLIFSSIQTRIQTNIKGQIAYASTAQIGIMFIELSLGFSKIVLIHLVCHALYRCFQLLVSPSVVASSSSLNNKVIVQKITNRKSWIDHLPLRFKSTLYVLGMTDFSMDISWRGFGFLPWRNSFHFVKKMLTISQLPYLLFFCVGLSFLYNDTTTSWALVGASTFFALKSILVRHNPFSAMSDLGLSFIGCMFASYLIGPEILHSIEAYFIPMLPFMLLALYITWNFRKYDLRTYHALGSAHTSQANLFMICFMVLSGLPVSTAFIGEDMLLEGLLIHSPVFTSVISFCFMINGLLCAKIYCRLFMGRPPVPL